MSKPLGFSCGGLIPVVCGRQDGNLLARPARALLALLLGFSSLAHASAIGDFLHGKREIEVITVTDMTLAGREVTPPTSDNPTYYMATNLGFRDLGPGVLGRRQPPSDEVIRIITAALAKQGFLPATDETPAPSLVLAFAWGTLDADIEFSENPEGSIPDRQRNHRQILRFLGGQKMRLATNERPFAADTPPVDGLTLMDFEAERFFELAEEDFYVAIVSAYDLAAVERREKRLLWMTRISCPSIGFTMPEVFPTMLAIGAPHFGRETMRPVWVNASDKYKAEVEFGKPEVIEFLEPGSSPAKEERSSTSDKAGEESDKKKTGTPETREP